MLRFGDIIDIWTQIVFPRSDNGAFAGVWPVR